VKFSQSTWHFRFLSLLLLLSAVIPIRAEGAESWEYEPDPLMSTLDVSPAASRIPSGRWELFPSQPSPFVLVANGAGLQKEYVYQIWDLRSGKSVSSVRVNETVWDDARLKADGRYLAGRIFDTGFFYSTVWDTRNGKVVWQETKDDLEVVKKIKARTRDFVAEDHVIMIGDRWVRIVNFSNGETVHEFECLDRCSDSKHHVLSPGRRYLARWESKAINLYDLTTGESVGTLKPPHYEEAYNENIIRFAFSDDGMELAALLKMYRKVDGRTAKSQGVVSWSLTDGELTAQHEISKQVVDELSKLGGYFGNITCLPDHSGWLVDNAGILDRKSGKIDWAVPAFGHLQTSDEPNQFLHVKNIQPGGPLFAVVKTPRNWSIAARSRSVAVAKEEPTRPSKTASTSESKAVVRTWTDKTGNFQIKAELVEFKDGKVTLRKTDGSDLTLPADKLSVRDQIYVRRVSPVPNDEEEAAAKESEPPGTD